MKIQVGGYYRAMVSGKETTVKVLHIVKAGVFRVQNLQTKRSLVFTDVSRFLSEVKVTDLGHGMKGVKVDEVILKGAEDQEQGETLDHRSAEDQGENVTVEGKECPNPTKTTASTTPLSVKTGYFGEEVDPLRPTVVDDSVCSSSEAPSATTFENLTPDGRRDQTASENQTSGELDGEHTPSALLECEESDACLTSMTEPGERCEVCGGVVAGAPLKLKTEEQRIESVIQELEVTSEQREDAARLVISEREARVFVEKIAQNLSIPASQLRPTGSDSTYSSATVPLQQMTSKLGQKLRAAMEVKPEVTTNQPPHVIVEARAGSGKTTTLIEGLKLLKGMGTSFTPSPQQKKVWEAICQSRDARSVCFVAFNKSIATELQRRVPAGCDAMTMHSMGYKAVGKAFDLKGREAVNQYRVSNIIEELLGISIRDLRRDKPVLVKATEDLVGLCKMNLVSFGGLADDYGADIQQLDQLVSHYDVDLNDSRPQIYDLVPKVLRRCLDVSRDGCIDFNDMIWLPVVLNLPVFKYDLLLWDESQDGNRCQQELAIKAGRRLVLCGDRRQAIYGFAGADHTSLQNMERKLGADARGCVILPLTVTRRCGKEIVKEAKKIVPDFEAFPTNPEGKISNARYPIQDRDGTRHELPWEQTYGPLVKDGDFVLCRVNSPLVSQCFKFLRRGIKANIQGRDIGQGLISTVKKLKADSVKDLVGKISDWLHKETEKEQAKRNPNENRLIALQDRAECLVCFTEGANTVDDVTRKIESIFTDDKNGTGIRFSSIHKAKGLESDRVFFLMPRGAECPHPMAKSAWQREQEYNCLYIGVTRARLELIYVS